MDGQPDAECVPTMDDEEAPPSGLGLGPEGGGRGLSLDPPTCKVARWQNLIPSFPLIAPGWRAWGRRVEGVGAQSKEKKGSNFAA